MGADVLMEQVKKEAKRTPSRQFQWVLSENCHGKQVPTPYEAKEGTPAHQINKFNHLLTESNISGSPKTPSSGMSKNKQDLLYVFLDLIAPL